VFANRDGCRIVAADPGVHFEWSEIERGHWGRSASVGKTTTMCLVPVCSVRPARCEDQPPRGRVRVRFRDRCRVLRLILKVKEGARCGGGT
jgi:hypothetical protein